MIHRGFDGNMALLLAAESGTMEMVEAILQTGKVDLNFTNFTGERLEDVAYRHGNFATHERLKRARLNSMMGKDSIARVG
jgi:ankyrin repeat protein